MLNRRNRCEYTEEFKLQIVKLNNNLLKNESFNKLNCD